MDLRNLTPSQLIDDRRLTFAPPGQPSFNYANPFRRAPSTDPAEKAAFDARGAEVPTGLAAQAGAGDLNPLVQALLAQRALEMLSARGQLPSYDWYNNAPLPQGDAHVGQDQSSPVGYRRQQ